MRSGIPLGTSKYSKNSWFKTRWGLIQTLLFCLLSFSLCPNVSSWCLEKSQTGQCAFLLNRFQLRVAISKFFSDDDNYSLEVTAGDRQTEFDLAERISDRLSNDIYTTDVV